VEHHQDRPPHVQAPFPQAHDQLGDQRRGAVRPPLRDSWYLRRLTALVRICEVADPSGLPDELAGATDDLRLDDLDDGDGLMAAAPVLENPDNVASHWSTSTSPLAQPL